MTPPTVLATTPTPDDAVRKWITIGLTLIPMILWIAYVISAGAADHGPLEPASLDDGWQLIGTGSGTALAAVAGSFLGIAVNLNTNYGLATRVRQGFAWPNLSISAWATIVYLLGIVLAFVIWALDKNRGTAEPVIQTAVGTLVGFGVGALKATTTKA